MGADNEDPEGDRVPLIPIWRVASVARLATRGAEGKPSLKGRQVTGCRRETR